MKTIYFLYYDSSQYLMNSLDIQALFTHRNQLDIQEWLVAHQYPSSESDQQLVYMAYLIAQGKFEETAHFMTDIEEYNPDQLVNLLTTPHSLFWDGTVLHVALYYNSGQRGLEFFQLLVSHGARYIKNYYNEFPWEQVGGVWFSLLDHTTTTYIDRDEYEFASCYQDIADMYHMSLVNPGQDQQYDIISYPIE